MNTPGDAAAKKKLRKQKTPEQGLAAIKKDGAECKNIPEALETSAEHALSDERRDLIDEILEKYAAEFDYLKNR